MTKIGEIFRPFAPDIQPPHKIYFKYLAVPPLLPRHFTILETVKFSKCFFQTAKGIKSVLF